jgi:pimeloyl-ACP methyl ester carboxylesterase
MFNNQLRQFVPGCVLILAVGVSQTVVAQIYSGRILEITIPAPSLEGNLLGDPTEQPMSIYLPPGYDSSPDKRYPVLYLLHGFKGTNRTWMLDPALLADGPLPESPEGGYGHRGMLTIDRLDPIIASGRIPGLIIVAPNGWNAYKHSYYVNSVVTGNWEDYIVKDVVGFVDANYRTLTQVASRGIGGHSGGGNGALYLGMRHPDVFGSVYAMAPCCSGDTFSLPPFESDTGELSSFWQNMFARLHALTSKDDLPPARVSVPADFYVNAQLAAGAAYAPNPNRPPLYADYLYEDRGGELVRNHAAFESRRVKSVYHMIDDYEDNLRALKGLLIDYGELEMEQLSAGNAEFASALGRRAIPFTLEVYAGGTHGNMVKERMETRGFEFFAEMLEFSPE